MANVPTQLLKVAGKFGSYGEDGKPGVTFTPSVSDDGILSWTNDGGLENPAPVNVKGKTGVHVGTEEPTDPNINVWIDPDDVEVNVIGTTDSTYYESLSQAIDDINNGTKNNASSSISTAKVRAFTGPSGIPVVMLLDDVEETTQININKDIELVLNEHLVQLTESAAYLSFNSGTCCTLTARGAGGIIKTIDVATSSQSLIANVSGDSLKVKGGTYTLRGNSTIACTVFAVAASNSSFILENAIVLVDNVNTNTASDRLARGVQNQGKSVEIHNSNITVSSHGYCQSVMGLNDIAITGSTLAAHSSVAEARTVFGLSGTVTIDNSDIKSSTDSTDSRAYGAYNPDGSTLTIRKTKILADAQGVNATTGSLAIACLNLGTAFIEDAEMNGTHSGVQNNGKMYVSGGTYTGYCHGGFYCGHGSSGEAYINDATIRCGYYEGDFDYSSMSGYIYGAMYVGGGTDANCSDMSVYLDGCTFDPAGCHTSIVIRGTDGEQNNTVNISNSTISALDDGNVRIDNETLKLNVGLGTDITADKIDNPSYAEFTDKLYRKNTDNDFTALVGYVDTKSQNGGSGIPIPETAEIGQTIVVKAVDENGKPTEWATANMLRRNPFGDDWGEPIVTIITEEEVSQIAINDAADCKEVLVSFTPAYSPTATSENVSGSVWIGGAFGGGMNVANEQMWERATTNNQKRFISSLWYACILGEDMGIGLNKRCNKYCILCPDEGATKMTSFIAQSETQTIGRIGFRTISGQYFGVGTKIVVWGRK